MDVTFLAELLDLPDLPRLLQHVEERLEDTLELDNPSLSEPALRVVRGGGKRLRPTLALAAAVGGGGSVSDDVVTGAAALELVHAGSLVHDDIMDGADERRGVPTVNKVEGANHAILVGDFLLARAGQLAAGVSREVAGVLAGAIADLCDGQSLETASIDDPGRTIDAYERSINGKTAALLRSSCEIGALSARLPDDAVKALSRYGSAFGMAFQVIDDLLDVVSTDEAMGKPTGQDLREGKYTLPLLLAMEADGADGLRGRLHPQLTAAEVDEVLDEVRRRGGLDAALDRTRAYNGEARRALESLAPNATVAGLAKLPDEYLAWALREKAGGYGLPVA